MVRKPISFSTGEESFTILVVPPFAGRFSGAEDEPEWMTQPPGRGTFEFQPEAEFQDVGSEIILRLELPGVDVEDIEISTADARITVGGQKRSEVPFEQSGTFGSERRFGYFLRSFILPFEVDATKTEAHLDKGVLTLRILKPEETGTQWKRIEIR